MLRALGVDIDADMALVGKSLATVGIAATSDLMSPMAALVVVSITTLAISVVMLRADRRLTPS